MSEYETTEEVQTSSVLTTSSSVTGHNETSSRSRVDPEVPNNDVLTSIPPANNNDNCLAEVINCSKESNTEESLPTAKNDQPASEGTIEEKAELIVNVSVENPHKDRLNEISSLPSESSLKERNELIKKNSSTEINNKLKTQPIESSNEPSVPAAKHGEPLNKNSATEKNELNENFSTEASESIKEPVVVSSKETSPPIDVLTENNLQNVTTEKSPKEPETTQCSAEYAEHVTYTDTGIAIYTDPKTQYKYKWCAVKSNWVSLDEETNPTDNGDGSQKSNPYENEHYRWCSDTNQWIPKTTEPTSSGQTETEHYRWDAEKNEWILKSQVSLDKVTYGYEDGVRTYTDKDGMVFFWDTEKKAWFPKIDDDFMARYQMSYGFIDNTSVAATTEEEVKNKESAKPEDLKIVDVPVGGIKRKAPPEPPKWFELDPTQNTKVYVSNLPLDITMDEFAEIMSKCGMIMRDPQTQKQKLKLYTEADGQIKGDGLCDYIKVESVDLALKLLDESVVRGSKIRVQRAKFQMRGEYNPTLKPKRKKKDKEKLLKMKEKLFDWRPEKMRGERSKHEKIVIIKNLFTPELFDKEVHLIIDYQNDLREECSKCGTVRKVVIYDRHAEGVAQVNMADPDEADLVVQMMNGRFFGKRKLIADIWDGKTKYKVAETEQEVKDRICKWDKYLETSEEKAEKEKGHLAVSGTTESVSDVTKDAVENIIPA